jgi:anti-sigma factor RsiW
MTCDDVLPLVEAYVDDELDLERSVALEAHLSGCAGCTARAEASRTLSRAVRTAPYHRAPDAFRGRLLGSTGPTGPVPARPAPRRWLQPWLLAAASIAIVVSGGLFARDLMQSSEASRMSQAIVDRHLASLMASHLTDVVSSDRHTVKPWFAGRVEFSPPVADLAAEGFPLSGGRLDYVAGHAAVALVYTRGAHVINVFVWPTTEPIAGAVASSDARGYQIVRWTSGGFSWWAVSDMAAPDLAEFARKLATASAPAGG